jgi:hypothetical protein
MHPLMLLLLPQARWLFREREKRRWKALIQVFKHSLLNSRSLAFGMTRSLLFLAIFALNLASIPLVAPRGISGF